MLPRTKHSQSHKVVIVDVHSGGLGEEEGWRKRTHGTEEGLRWSGGEAHASRGGVCGR